MNTELQLMHIGGFPLQEIHRQSDSKTAVVIDFQSKKAVNKGASL